MPDRIQLLRTKGWKMPPGTVKVDRTTKWGNPFAVGEVVPPELVKWLDLPTEQPGRFAGLKSVKILDRQRVIDTYTYWLIEQPILMLSLGELKGKDLGCWCKPGDLCHADVLLNLANETA